MIGSYTVIQSTMNFISKSNVNVAIYPFEDMIPNIGENIRVTKTLKVSQKKFLTQDESKNNVYTFAYNKNYDKLYYCDDLEYIIIGNKSYLNEGLYHILSPYYKGEYDKKCDEITVYIGKDQNLCLKFKKIHYRGYRIYRMYYNHYGEILNHIFNFSEILCDYFNAKKFFGEKFCTYECNVIEFKFSEFVKNKYCDISHLRRHLLIKGIMNDEDSILIDALEINCFNKRSSVMILLYKNRYMFMCEESGVLAVDFESDKALVIPYDSQPSVYKYDDKIYIDNHIIYFDENGDMKVKKNNEGIKVHNYVFLNGCEVCLRCGNIFSIDYFFNIPLYIYFLESYLKHEQYGPFKILGAYVKELVIKKENKSSPSEGDLSIYVPPILTPLYEK